MSDCHHEHSHLFFFYSREVTLHISFYLFIYFFEVCARSLNYWRHSIFAYQISTAQLDCSPPHVTVPCLSLSGGAQRELLCETHSDSKEKKKTSTATRFSLFMFMSRSKVSVCSCTAKAMPSLLLLFLSKSQFITPSELFYSKNSGDSWVPSRKPSDFSIRPSWY